MKEDKEQISEEFSHKLLLFTPDVAYRIRNILYSNNKKQDKWGRIKKLILNDWKRWNHIKLSREEEIRNVLRDSSFFTTRDDEEMLAKCKEIIELQEELIEILDNKDKK
jgi:hypothetical protein